MWNDRRSLILSKCCVVLFMAALAFCAVTAPGGSRLWRWLVPADIRTLFLVTLYLGCVPAALLLICLYMLLHRIGVGEIFVRENTECLRNISWCCFAGSVICFASSFYWTPWCAVGVAAAFMGLIVRVVKNIIAKAVLLKDDADFTI